MRILITGGSGFLGCRAASYLSSLDYDVLKPSHGQLDITDQAAVNLWFQKNQPEAVIHCAAISDTGACQRDPERSALINVTGSIYLATACESVGAKLIFCSSDQVYHASTLPGPHTEEEILTPRSVYACQKLFAEQQCRKICPNTVCLRLSWMYSSQFLPMEHGHLLTTLRTALPDSSQAMSWPSCDFRGITDVDSVVRQLPAALSLPGGVYNFGAENDTDMFHTIQTVLTELNLQDALNRMTPNPQYLPRDIRMDGSHAASYGIFFEPTCQGLCRALQQII